MPADIEIASRLAPDGPAASERASLGASITGGLRASLPIAGVLLAAFVFCLCDPQMFLDGDTNWHLAAGRWILAHGSAPHADPFSYTALGTPWLDLEWLSEALMALCYGLAGWSAVMVLMAAAVAATEMVVAVELRKWLGAFPATLVLAVCFPMIAKHVLARPHLLALPLLAVWMTALLDARRRGQAPSLWLALLMTLWANLHGSYLLGLALVLPFGLEAVLEHPDRRRSAALGWGGFALASALAALVTPYGLAGLIHAVAITRMTSLASILEWKPASFAQTSPLEITLLAGLLACLARGVRLRWTRAAVLLFVLHLALHHLRHELILAVIAPMILAEPLGGAAKPARASPARAWARATFPVFGAALAVGTVLAVLRLGAPETVRDSAADPVTALANVPADIAIQPVFNDYGFGGRLILGGVRPFIDGRNDLYGDAAFQTYLNAEQARSPEAAARVFDRYGVTWTILTPSSPLVALLDKTPGWVRYYGDAWAVVHLRADALAASERAQALGARAGSPPAAATSR